MSEAIGTDDLAADQVRRADGRAESAESGDIEKHIQCFTNYLQNRDGKAFVLLNMAEASESLHAILVTFTNVPASQQLNGKARYREIVINGFPQYVALVGQCLEGIVRLTDIRMTHLLRADNAIDKNLKLISQLDPNIFPAISIAQTEYVKYFHELKRTLAELESFIQSRQDAKDAIDKVLAEEEEADQAGKEGYKVLKECFLLEEVREYEISGADLTKQIVNCLNMIQRNTILITDKEKRKKTICDLQRALDLLQRSDEYYPPLPQKKIINPQAFSAPHATFVKLVRE